MFFYMLLNLLTNLECCVQLDFLLIFSVLAYFP